MQIELKYENPSYPLAGGFLFYELAERFMQDDRENDKLRAIRYHLKLLWQFGNNDDFKSEVDEVLEMDQQKGIVKVHI